MWFEAVVSYHLLCIIKLCIYLNTAVLQFANMHRDQMIGCANEGKGVTDVENSKRRPSKQRSVVATAASRTPKRPAGASGADNHDQCREKRCRESDPEDLNLSDDSQGKSSGNRSSSSCSSMSSGMSRRTEY
jgi:hypothetical protein